MGLERPTEKLLAKALSSQPPLGKRELQGKLTLHTE